ncbi:MAG: HAMP domain-containing histidine kinase, partial [Cyclobacteriaceae bacterium]|nr:HAMP domain-containing histidine kinase [Cyclobacteriaceae bacterium]
KEETSDYLANLQTTTVDLKDTLSNVIHWTALQANERPVAPQYIDCQSLVQSLISKTEAQYSQKKLTIDVFIPEGQQVFADRSMIETVLQNLFSNAIHFTPAGGRITFFSGRNEDLVTLGVKDTGIGIRKEDVARLFSAKEDFHTIGKSRHKGAGVGLLVCKEMVERNGGRMYVESEEGQGSNFYFSLPERKIN